MPDVDVVKMTRAEYKRVATAELRRLGLTFAQLCEQARTRQFTSENARRLWLAIGGNH